MTTDDGMPRSLGEGWRDLELSDTERLTELFEVSFGQHRSHEDWVWLYLDAPGRVDTFVYDPDGEAMAFMGQLWFEAWVEGRRAVLPRRRLHGGSHHPRHRIQRQHDGSAEADQGRGLSGLRVSLPRSRTR